VEEEEIGGVFLPETQAPRKTRIRLIYEGADISEDIAPYLLSFEYTDKYSGEADDLQITLEDRDMLWRDPWYPDKGAKISASITTENWEQPGETTSLYCGTFEIDEIEVSESPLQVNIKATAAPRSTNLRNESKNRNWEGYNLSGIARDIADNAGLALEYLPSDDPVYDTRNQVEQDDLSFLQKLCADGALALKVTDTKIVIFDEEEYEGRAAVSGIERGGFRILSMSIKTKLADTYRSAKVKYNDTEKGVTHESLIDDGGVEESGQTLQVIQRVGSQGEAEDLARSKLHEANKHEVTGSFTLAGDIGLVAGVNVAISGYGKFDGTYFVESAKHSYGEGGYTTQIEVREGGPSKKKKKGKKSSAPVRHESLLN
jgi:phage protein D